MKCPQCQFEMVKSPTKWLCPNCGHVQGLEEAPLPNAVVVKKERPHGLVSRPPEPPATPPDPETVPSNASAPHTNWTANKTIQPPASLTAAKPAAHVPELQITPPTIAPASTATPPPAAHVTPPAAPAVPPPPAPPVVPTPPPADSAPSMSATPQTSQPFVIQPPPANVMPAELQPPAPPRRLKRGIKLALIIGGPVLGLLIAGGGAAYYAFGLAPKDALAGYLQKISQTKSATVATSVEFNDQTTTSSAGSNSQTDSSQFTANLTGNYDLHDAKKPKIDLQANGKFSNYSLSGEFRFVDNTAYFKLGSLDFVSSYLGVNLSNDWYKYQVNNFGNNGCTTQALLPAASQLTPTRLLSASTLGSLAAAVGRTGNFLGYRYPTNLPVKDTKLGAYNEAVAGGHHGTHYSGAIDFKALPEYLNSLNQSLPANCRISYNTSDFKNLTVTYDLWVSSHFDRLQLKAVTSDSTSVDTYSSKSTSTTTVTADTSDYNKSVNITAPTGAKDLSQLLGDAFGGGSATTSGTVTNPTPPPAASSSVSSQAQQRDAQRVSDANQVATIIEQYISEHNGAAPASTAAAAQAVKSVNPTLAAKYTFKDMPDGYSGGGSTGTTGAAGQCPGSPTVTSSTNVIVYAIDQSQQYFRLGVCTEASNSYENL